MWDSISHVIIMRFQRFINKHYEREIGRFIISSEEVSSINANKRTRRVIFIGRGETEKKGESRQRDRHSLVQRVQRGKKCMRKP